MDQLCYTEQELLKKYPNVDKIETLYSAKLNENANVVTGTLPNSKDNNPNTAYLTYSNNPQDTTGVISLPLAS